MHISNIFNCQGTNINGMSNARNQGGCAKHLNLYYRKSFLCGYGLNQHLLILNLSNVSINKTLATEFITVKVSQNLNLM